MRTSKESQISHKQAVIAGVCVVAAGLAIAGCAATRSRQASLPEIPAPAIKISEQPRTPAQCLAALPLKFLAGQVLMLGVQADGLSTEAALFKQYDIGGAAMMTAPANPSDGSIAAFKATAASESVPVLVATDEEGGSVQRFSVLGALPAPQEVAATMSPAQAEQLVEHHGTLLKAAGVDMVLGPLADVAPAQGTGALGDRVFSADPGVVAAYAAAYVHGWQEAGLAPTLKHFPGMGSASTNTDYGVAVTPPLSELKQRDFLPYRGQATSGTAVMIGNQNVPGWFMGPASLSPVANKYLRQALGYQNNLVITDSLSVPAVAAAAAEANAAVAAITAGNDIALLVEPGASPTPAPGVILAAEAGLEQAVQGGAIPKQQLVASVLRKLALQHVSACTLAPAKQ